MTIAFLWRTLCWTRLADHGSSKGDTMGKTTAVVGSIVLASMVPSTQAATVVQAGSLNPGYVAITTLGGSVNLAPGRYRFQLDLSEPVDGVAGFLTKWSNFLDYCDFGSGLVVCGGNGSATGYGLTQSGPRTYASNLTVLPLISTTSNIPAVRRDYFDVCCDYVMSIYSNNGGTYKFSYNAVPEPAAWTLMLLGVGAIGSAMRGQRSSARSKAQYRFTYS